MPRALSHNGLVALKLKALDYREVYAGLLQVCKEKGYRKIWADYKFKEIYGGWPKPKTPVEPREPSMLLREWIGIDRTRYRARKRREEVRAAGTPLLERNASERP